MKNHELSVKPLLTKICAAIALVSLAGCGGSGGGGNNKSSAALSSAALSSVAPSSTAASSSSAPATAEWKLVWSDEFDGASIDTSKWNFEKNCWGGGNNEQQCYTDRATNAYVADGVLNIVAQREDFTGSDSPEGDSPSTKTLPYTSARLRTKNIKEWTFGRFEIRAKLPAGQGTWPAIWMLPTNSPYGTWASSGEIDIMEAVNLKVVTNGSEPEANVHGTLHFGRNWPGNVNSGAAYKLPNKANPADDFHTYAVEWEEGEIRWYVDNVHFATQRETGWYGQYMQDGVLKDAPLGAPFDRYSKFHLLLNLAVGGSWAGNVNNKGIDESVFPQKMLVDFVRVYECTGSPITGKGCATIDANAEIVAGHQRPVIGAVKLPEPPLFLMYDNALASVLQFDSYNPDGAISHSQVEEAGRGNVWSVVKTGANGNVYFKIKGDPADMSNWSTDSEIVFDYKVNSKADGAKLLVKIDSGWPNVSDVSVPVAELGVWKEFRITLANLIANGNSLASGKATLTSVVNSFVVDPSAAMNVSLDNIRLEGKAATGGGTEFAALPLFTAYGDAIGEGLQVQSYNPSGHISSSEKDEAGRGKVFNVVKTGTDGNVFFNVISNPVNLTKWSAQGKLKFDFKVNSKAEGTALLIKMDSGWPNVSDVSVPLPANGVWTSYSIGVAELIARGNSVACCPGIAKLNAITNLFVVEPSGAIDVSFDNVRLETE
ncbi:glycoside hydrolase family 16 protein [Cellvibrio sp. OA-2007]|uniref:glycoside hydrolase family 16 protein n=1 Tax=Cellvibrio sp. OA-2007 TaxID=529823 RepID=UPI000A00A5EF|nr:glycoside hydrolase family 16 protein [Cellvibrio sp. OA-2007]